VVEVSSLFGSGTVSLDRQIAPFQKDPPSFMFGAEQYVIPRLRGTEDECTAICGKVRNYSTNDTVPLSGEIQSALLRLSNLAQIRDFCKRNLCMLLSSL